VLRSQPVLPPETGAFAAAFTHRDTITARLAGVDVVLGSRSAAASLGRSAAELTLAETREKRTRLMTVLVGRRESFSAAHQLCDPDLSDDENRRLFGKCTHLHGHNYVLEVVVAGEIDQASGYVLDLKLLSDVIGRQVIRDVDHRNLNTDVAWLKGLVPTTENLAQAVWERLQPELPDGLLRSVRVWETDKNWAEVGDQA
jgi:6-pyruvoyltetrahydropterin/6-carboxytetrahydropterin synthase